MVLMMGTESVTRRKRMNPATGAQRMRVRKSGTSSRVKKKAGNAERASMTRSKEISELAGDV
jgi:hypothetical protein